MCAGVVMREKIVAGVSGMPGAGKATVKEIVQEIGYPVVVMGDVIRAEVERRKLEPTPENLGWVMLKLREEEGAAVVAKRCIPKIKELKEKIIIIDGIRSTHEVKDFKKQFPNFIIVAIHASPETRFKRLFNRKRSDDPRIRETFIERDLRELNVGLGDVIATADHLIVNEGTKGQLRRKVDKLFGSILKKWMI
jgi:dephospho-CoA kinase